LKWAESQDGFIAPDATFRKALNNNEKKPIWITSPYSRQLVHKCMKRRAGYSSGTQTVMMIIQN
jgi:diaminohydroxyphosphoribosylaminopyrimidine deaminase/5-amino-6-(5-phosphoribosylamino)uracil reductase